MRLSVLFAATAGIALAQSATSTTVVTDLNGHPVTAATSISTSTVVDQTQTKLSQSLNGRRVPLEQIEERVLRNDSTGKLTERILRRYDPNGQLASTERVVTEEQPKPGGGLTVHATMYRSDLNGREREAERRVSETRVAGVATTTETSIQRPNISGSFETAEKLTAVSSGDDANKTTTETVYRPSENGGLREALQRVVVATKSGNQSIQKTAEYEPSLNGALELKRQTVETTSKRADGGETAEMNLYGPDGLLEQQTVTRAKAADGSVIETFSVRRPTVSDPIRLGSPEKVSETVCTGKCGPVGP